jgi:hypothetical protein
MRLALLLQRGVQCACVATQSGFGGHVFSVNQNRPLALEWRA